MTAVVGGRDGTAAPGLAIATVDGGALGALALTQSLDSQLRRAEDVGHPRWVAMTLAAVVHCAAKPPAGSGRRNHAA